MKQQPMTALEMADFLEKLVNERTDVPTGIPIVLMSELFEVTGRVYRANYAQRIGDGVIAVVWAVSDSASIDHVFPVATLRSFAS